MSEDARQPLEDEFVKSITGVMEALDEVWNGNKKHPDKEIGFCLLLYKYGDDTGRCNYASNGADRRDMIKLFREQADRFEADLEGKPYVQG